jgi:hypothetical protein
VTEACLGGIETAGCQPERTQADRFRLQPIEKVKGHFAHTTAKLRPRLVPSVSVDPRRILWPVCDSTLESKSNENRARCDRSNPRGETGYLALPRSFRASSVPPMMPTNNRGNGPWTSD